MRTHHYFLDFFDFLVTLSNCILESFSLLLQFILSAITSKQQQWTTTTEIKNYLVCSYTHVFEWHIKYFKYGLTDNIHISAWYCTIVVMDTMYCTHIQIPIASLKSHSFEVEMGLTHKLKRNFRWSDYSGNVLRPHHHVVKEDSHTKVTTHTVAHSKACVCLVM